MPDLVTAPNPTLELLGTSELELVYLAGLFDGEGSINIARSLRRGKETARLCAEVRMTESAPLYIYQKIFGGSLTFTQSLRKGIKDIYHWRVRGAKAITFITVIEPYLIVKKEKAILALSLAAYHGLESPAKILIGNKISKRRNTKKGENDA